MDKVGVLVVSKCLSGAAIIDTISRSERYTPEFYIVERQVNPFNMERAEVHAVVPDLAVAEVAKVAKRYAGNIAFGLTDTEDFVTAGGRDIVERESGVQMLCVSRKFAVEGSKAGQRVLFDHIFRRANPKYRVFDGKDYANTGEAVSDFTKSLEDFREPVVKPDRPARGAGVGVWGADFSTREGAAKFFEKGLAKGRVLVEEKVEGEESSFHAFSDGRHFVPAPMTRDYKRGLDGDEGPLTGGMGSYRGPDYHLPFLRKSDNDLLVRDEERSFRRWRGRDSEPGLRGVVLYDAIMHTGRGFKVLERNSRGGNTEFINLLSTIADDFVDVCFRMLDGSLKGIKFESTASVATCAVPSSYGVSGVPPSGPGPIGLARAYALAKRSEGRIRVFPMDVRVDGDRTVMGTSRSVAVVGLGKTVEEARGASLEGCSSIVGLLRWRKDIASHDSISRSAAHLRGLRHASG
ncbi:MAG: hypothetical protein HY296_05970 [Thaumarchaeota archaeon]|nr:hypothetical protein [Nitrososphaerota archaeon]